MAAWYGKAPRAELERGGEGYPACLEDLEDPPERLYVMGDAGVLGEPSLSVIGARKATPYGESVATLAGRVAAECDIVMVSGGAIGCDSAAARGALAAGGRTVVVSGCGADLVYPPQSQDVFEMAVRRGGAVVSLDPWGVPPRRFSFPKRNRVIAALSQSVLIAEAGERSGTMSTAQVANQIGRDLYAVPGSIFSPESVGTNRLIGEGAYIITSERDLEARISLDYGVLRLAREGGPLRLEGRVLSSLVAEPMRADDLARHIESSPLDVISALSDYESRGVVCRLPDGRFSLTAETYLAHDRMCERHAAELSGVEGGAGGEHVMAPPEAAEGGTRG